MTPDLTFTVRSPFCLYYLYWENNGGFGSSRLYGHRNPTSTQPSIYPDSGTLRLRANQRLTVIDASKSCFDMRLNSPLRIISSRALCNPFYFIRQSKGRAPFQPKTDDLPLKGNIADDFQGPHPMDPVKWSVQRAPPTVLSSPPSEQVVGSAAA